MHKRCVLLIVCLLGTRVAAAQSDLQPLLGALRQVDREAQGNRAAASAWSDLTARAKPTELTVILAAVDGAGPLAANWLRSAFDAVAERNLQQNGKLPVAELEKFLHDQRHDPRARRLAFEWIARADTTAPDRLIPQMLDDPSLEMRRDAVARVLAAAEKATAADDKPRALATYRKALASARDLDQVKIVTEAMKKLGQPVDLSYHFGFLQDWKLLGPFDNHQGKGFAAVYGPEEKIDAEKSFDAEGKPLQWIAHHTDDEYGYVDLNKAIGKHNGVAAYALAEFRSQQAMPIELRLGSDNANKIWLNGKLLSAADVYHSNNTMDQYTGRGQLKAGVNLILLKICQNEQTEDWAQDWKFQLRVCDSGGGAILASDRPAPRPADTQATPKTSEK